jgi:hypothetical protein
MSKIKNIIEDESRKIYEKTPPDIQDAIKNMTEEEWAKFQKKGYGVKTDEVQLALEVEPETLREAMTQWRVLSDHVIEVKSTIGEHEEKIKELKKIIQSKLFIADNAEISETVSIPGVGSASKKKTISIRVHDWKSFQAYLARNNMEAVMRHQCNLRPSEELYDLVMDGELPAPQSAEFTTFEKLSLRRN